MYNGHQSNDVLSVNTVTMKKVSRFSNRVGHSFNQSLLISKDDEAVFVNHGDAYPRGIETAKEHLSDPQGQERNIAEKESRSLRLRKMFHSTFMEIWEITGPEHSLAGSRKSAADFSWRLRGGNP